MSEFIKQCVPGAKILKNQIPKEYVSYEIYTGLISNDDLDNPYYDIVPKIGAFEVSHLGYLVFSKMISHCWPNWGIVAGKC
tara:strand:+ start:337 stop:579 length:243 start_codon:yes stop_codon:yes gene_type:complete